MSGEHIPLESFTESDERLIALFDGMEAKQLDFLDEAGKRLIELITGLLGVLFAVTAFGDKFPPPYLRDNELAKGLTILTLVLYILAMLAGMIAIQPRTYPRYEHNLDKMRDVFNAIRQYKKRRLRLAGVLFWLGSLTLAGLVISVITQA